VLTPASQKELLTGPISSDGSFGHSLVPLLSFWGSPPLLSQLLPRPPLTYLGSFPFLKNPKRSPFPDLFLPEKLFPPSPGVIGRLIAVRRMLLHIATHAQDQNFFLSFSGRRWIFLSLRKMHQPVPNPPMSPAQKRNLLSFRLSFPIVSPWVLSHRMKRRPFANRLALSRIKESLMII